MTLPIIIAKILRLLLRLMLALFTLTIIFMLAIPIGFYGMALYLEPTLPSVTEIKTASRQMPLQIYSNDNLLIGQYGNRMSLPVKYDDIPNKMVHALLAAEDASFFKHSGISVKGLGRAITQLVTNDNSQTGGSTITMQVAKNYFLTPEQTFERKLTELFLSRKIEQNFTKDEIMTLYVNKIYLGEGAYGIQAAARRYYSKSLNNLTIAETAMLAGLPKAPSKYNPVANPKRALERRNWILGRMFALGHINEQQYNEAIESPIGLNTYSNNIDDDDMEYQAEMARISLVNQFGQQVMNSGWRVRLTVNSETQHKANEIVRKHLLNYDHRHGWRGPEATSEDSKSLKDFQSFANMHPVKIINVGDNSFIAEMQSGKKITVPWSGMSWARKYISANRVGRHPSRPSNIVNQGDIVRVSKNGDSWRLVQIPKIQGSLVSLNPKNGAIVAAVGGFHFKHSKFNRATDGWRQPGSTIKPLIYSAALEKGYLPTSLINDSPLKIGDWRPKNSDGRYYGPMQLRKALYLSRNLVSIRLLQSVGMANARSLLDQFGLDKEKLPTTLSLALGTGQASPLQMATAYSAFANGGHRIQPFLIEQIYTFDQELIYQANPSLSCAVCFNDSLDKLNEIQRLKAEIMRKSENSDYGSMSIAELESELEKITEKKVDKELLEATDEKPKKSDKNTLEDSESTSDTDLVQSNSNKNISEKNNKAHNVKVNNINRLKVYPVEYKRAEQAQRILSPSVAYEMAGILKDVVDRGTATRARALGRKDIGGKTGTTNNFKDAWFAGFHPTNVTVVWVGFDTPSTLGHRMYGGKLALPVWMDYMKFQLENTPNQWVTLDNNAESEKKTQETIDITNEGVEKAAKNKDESQKKLPTGTPFKRPIPVAPPRSYKPRASTTGLNINRTHSSALTENINQQPNTTVSLGLNNHIIYNQRDTTSSNTINNSAPAYNNSDSVSNMPTLNKPVTDKPTSSEEHSKVEQPLDVVEVDEIPPMPTN